MRVRRHVAYCVLMLEELTGVDVSPYVETDASGAYLDLDNRALRRALAFTDRREPAGGEQ